MRAAVLTAVALSFASSWLQAGDVAFRVDVLDSGASTGRRRGDAVPWELGVPVGQRRVPVTAGVYLVSHLPEAEEGVQGWSLSLEVDDCFQIVDATTDGTAGANARIDPKGLRDGGFEMTEIVDPNANGGRSGVVTGVVLDFGAKTSLDPVGEELVLRINGRMDASAISEIGDRTESCAIRPLERGPWLRGTSQPVETIATTSGDTIADLDAVAAEVTLEGTRRLFEGEFRVDILSPPATREERNGSTVPWNVSVPVDSDVVPVTAAVHLVSEMHDRETGVEAWSLSLLAEPCFDVLDATTGGTVGDAAPVGLRTVGFEATEIARPDTPGNDGRGGVVTAVILAFGGGVTLDPVGDERILKVTGEMSAAAIDSVGDTTAPCSVRPVSIAPWLRGDAQPVETLVTVKGNSVVPPAVGTIGAAVTLEGSAPMFEGEFRADVLNVSATRGPRIGDAVKWSLPAAPGSGSIAVRTGVYLVSNLASLDEGAEAWSLSVETEDCFHITHATTAGTVAANSLTDPAGKRFVGFERTEIVDPARNNGRSGVVSAVILSVGGSIALDPVSEDLVLRITGDMDTSGIRLSDGPTPPCTVRPLTGFGLRGTGQPLVDTLVTVKGEAFLARGVAAEISLNPGAVLFRRGDANGDGRVNIADPLAILNFLFSDGRLRCRDAADTNDSGGVNIADAVSLYLFLFAGEAPPPAPGPFECGPDPLDDDDLECAEYSCP